MALTLDDLFASPDHYLHSFEGDAALFMPMDRDAYHRSIFLDGRISPKANQQMRVAAAALTCSPAPTPKATSWIFHVAHCGSTLLARALDRTDGNLVLREPLALRQIALAPEAGRLAIVAAMVSKRYRAEAPTLVKANVPVNFLLPELAGKDPGARAIFLHLKLRDYLLAILRDEGHRTWLRRVTELLAPHLGDVGGLADAERAAALWLAQMRAFAAAIAGMPNARSLDAEAFFAEPARVLGQAAEAVAVELPAAEIEAMVGGPLFATYSKNPEQAFDNQMRVARRQALERDLAAELDRAEAWVGGRGAEALAVVDRAALG